VTVELGVVDVEKALVAHLGDNSDLTAAGCRRVSTDIGGPYPMLRVIRTGGPFDGYRLDRPAVQLEAWGEPNANDDAVCSRIMRTALAVLATLPAAVLPGFQASWVTHLTTNQRLPDVSTNQQRRVSTVVISAHTKP
jgi:hypothetical protein